jgi:hypothetical protein
MNEWNIYKKIVRLLRVIPNYKKYFLLDNFSACVPDKLTTQDKINFESCDALDEYNSENINNNLNELMLINMPHGGKNLDEMISNNLISYNDLTLLINNLIMNAILPMNKLNIYHFDLKANNILYKNNNLKIIDFGTVEVSNKTNSIPKRLLKPLGVQYNCPLSTILFNPFILSRINYSLKKSKISISNIINMFKGIYSSFIYNFSEGQERLLEEILIEIYKIKKKKITNIKKTLRQIIYNYCAHAIFKFIDIEKQEFDSQKYFDTVYSKNMDVIGVLSSYTHYILTPHPSYSNEFRLHIIDVIYELFFTSKYAITVIPIAEIMSKLNKITL